MVEGVTKPFGNDGEVVNHVARRLRGKHRGEKDAFTYPPLGEAHRLTVIDEHFAGSPSGKADDSKRGVTLETPFVHRHGTAHHVAQHARPPRAGLDRTDVNVAGPANVVLRNPPIDPQVFWPQEDESSATPTPTQSRRGELRGINDVRRLTSAKHQRGPRCTRDEHRGLVDRTKNAVVVEVVDLRHEARGRYGAHRGSGSGTWRQRHHGPSGVLGSKCIRHPISSRSRSPFCMLWRRHAATTFVHSWRPPRERGTT